MNFTVFVPHVNRIIYFSILESGSFHSILCPWDTNKFYVSFIVHVCKVHAYVCLITVYSCPWEKYMSKHVTVTTLELGVPTWMSLWDIWGSVMMQKSLLTWVALGVCGPMSWKCFLDTRRRVTAYYFFSSSSHEVSPRTAMHSALSNPGSPTNQLYSFNKGH